MRVMTSMQLVTQPYRRVKPSSLLQDDFSRDREGSVGPRLGRMAAGLNTMPGLYPERAPEDSYPRLLNGMVMRGAAL